MSSLNMAFVTTVPVIFSSISSSITSTKLQFAKAKRRTNSSRTASFPIASLKEFLRFTQPRISPPPPPPPPPALRALVTQFVLHESSIRQSKKEKESLSHVKSQPSPFTTWFSRIFMFVSTVIAAAIGAPTPPKV